MTETSAPKVGSVTFRRANANDAVAAAEVLIRAREAALGAIRATAQSDEDTRRWVEDGLIPHCEVWVAEAEDHQVLALLVLDEDWIDQLYVRPDAAGLGIGSGLVELAKQNCPDGLQTRTSLTNPGARRFYERHGFVLAPPDRPVDDQEKQASLRYVWPASKV